MQLTSNQYEVMHVLTRSGYGKTFTTKELVENLGGTLSYNQVSGILRRLENRKIVDRNVNSKNIWWFVKAAAYRAYNEMVEQANASK